MTRTGDAARGTHKMLAKQDIGGCAAAGPVRSLNLPTILTIMRIILVAPLMICIFMDNLPTQIISIIIFTIASLTDFIDGRLARKNHQVTKLGAFLDPLADKMLINLTFLALVVMGLMPLWMFGVILIRDFTVDGMRMMMAASGTVVSASIYGKLKTTVQMIAVISILTNRITNLEVWSIINLALLYIVVLLTILSGIIYLKKGFQKLK
ncbi:CDP-diacylglycerol--glycerol-3-phosphate 3-phosphatidyltransferase [Candidatus Saccharibacteria bacterium]|nr:CDP-diacylglycerol--glycerol-3-phosphate 3-phosphatidyltransferase [Candidatus Saccharibacteria bacterium]